ncbi:Hypothetical protein, putative [Bodo saltans]|uniref:Uncharacterized protein n=1 Tax=Bodo saltans TaxID=75058 RepID=A0A0S4IX57_BODSA|nr:Hypothetical protein, putative [Bodo saltans]|eukprot:CUG06708.1 Hypothetical protein, putative [Bodo saltans]
MEKIRLRIDDANMHIKRLNSSAEVMMNISKATNGSSVAHSSDHDANFIPRSEASINASSNDDDGGGRAPLSQLPPVLELWGVSFTSLTAATVFGPSLPSVQQHGAAATMKPSHSPHCDDDHINNVATAAGARRTTTSIARLVARPFSWPSLLLPTEQLSLPDVLYLVRKKEEDTNHHRSPEHHAATSQQQHSQHVQQSCCALMMLSQQHLLRRLHSVAYDAYFHDGQQQCRRVLPSVVVTEADQSLFRPHRRLCPASTLCSHDVTETGDLALKPLRDGALTNDLDGDKRPKRPRQTTSTVTTLLTFPEVQPPPPHPQHVVPQHQQPGAGGIATAHSSNRKPKRVVVIDLTEDASH